MKRFVYYSLVIGASLFASCSEGEEPRNDSQDEPQATVDGKAYLDVAPLEALVAWGPGADEKPGLESMADFAYSINSAIARDYERLWPLDESGNYSVSPVSISIYLAALSQSVDGQARMDICKMMGLGEEETVSLSNKLLRSLNGDKEIMNVCISNSVWHVESMPITDVYAEKMARNFGMPVNILDLYSPKSLEVLNGWCSDKTGGMFNDIFSEVPGVDFILANAMYFSGLWGTEFDKSLTAPATFFGSRGESTVDMMHLDKLISPHACVDGVEYIQLPCGVGCVVDVIMPADGTDMEAFGRNLSRDYISALESVSDFKHVDFRLPKFSDRHKADIRDLLVSLGYPAYDMKASEMTGDANATIPSERTKVKHATAINVNEDGVEMSALTFGEMLWGPGPSDMAYVEMTVDRPFYYVVRHRSYEAVMMVGRVCNL